jgi:lysyl-tRNA synthetase class 1
MANNWHWADETAQKIITEKGGGEASPKDLYTCASGITPSGSVHIGNFREIISVDLVVRALRDKGKKVRFIYSWDDYDVFRKVPKNMPQQDVLTAHLRFPITMVPDPWGRNDSYARHHEVDIESVLPRVGIHPEYLYQAQRYRSDMYAEGERKALQHKDDIKAIFNKYRDEQHKITGVYWPIAVFCGKCNRDNTEITGWDGDNGGEGWKLSYRCKDCGNEETIDLRTSPLAKLHWRVDWPMRWNQEHVDFEPAGKDHHSQGGSFDTSKQVVKVVYGATAPVTFRYDFIGTKGLPGKMSSSSGNVITLWDVLKVYTPEVARFLFASKIPQTEFSISFDLDVLKIYEDYDKCERIALGIDKAKDSVIFNRTKRIYELSQPQTDSEGRTIPAGSGGVKPYQFPFRHLCNLIQIHGGDIDATLAWVKANGVASPASNNQTVLPTDEQLAALRCRAECAKYWVAECAPEEFRFSLCEPGTKAALNEAETGGVKALRDSVVAKLDSFKSDKDCGEAVYAAAEQAGIDSKTLFRASYQALIAKDQGPRLANFLRTVGKDRLMAILAVY